jgi:branched-chain amino acid aminotransferase
MVSFFNDQFLPEESVALPASDLAIQRGYGAFDFFKTLNYKPVFLKEHLTRFYHSASRLFLPVPYEAKKMELIIKELIHRNGIAESGIRITLTGGLSADGYSIGSPNLIITQKSLPIPSSLSTNSYKLITYSYARTLPDVKSIDYLMAVWLQKKCQEAGADDILYVQEGNILECPRSNIFLVHQDGTIRTPAQGILKGVTRNKLIEILKDSYTVIEEDINLVDLQHAKEAFITSTTKMILPVTTIDAYRFKGNTVCKRLFDVLDHAIRKGCTAAPE